jgi:glucokinase
MKENEFVVGVDIGGTNTAVGVVDHTGGCRFKSSFSTRGEHTAEKFIFTLASTVSELCTKVDGNVNLCGIAIAAPAAIRHEGRIQSPANLQWGTIDIVNMLKQYYTLPVIVTNDSNAAALGEMKYGLAKGMKNFVVITMGTGLGAGIVVDGRLIYGENGVAGELGHTTIDPGGRMCGCKRRGCVETYVSATGIRRTVFELLARSTEETELREIAYNRLTAEKIHELALHGDPIAVEAFEITGELLGRMLSNTVAVFDPETIILSGGLMNAGDLLLGPTTKSFNNNVLELHKKKVAILKSQFKEGEAAILGACSLVGDASPTRLGEPPGKTEVLSGKVILEGQV